MSHKVTEMGVTQMDHFTLLPEELLELLITYLDGISTQRLGSTCSFFHHLTSKPEVWHRLLARTRVTAITREVEKLARGNPRAIYFLSHRLRGNWGSGLVREEKVATLPRVEKCLWLAASETWAAWVCPGDSDQDLVLQLFDLIHGRGGQGPDFGGAFLSIPDATDLHAWKQVDGIFVLDSFIIVLRYGDRTYERVLADMVVFSIQDKAFLYNQWVVHGAFSYGAFIRDDAHLDVTQFKDIIAAFQCRNITLYQVMRDQIVVKVLEVEKDIGGILQYCKFLTWDNTHMAHPFKAHPGNSEELDAEVEHRIYCWDQRTWERKVFKINGQVNGIQHSLALHGGKLFAAQTSTVRIWDVSTVRIWDMELEILEKVSTLDDILPGAFIITEGIGIHLHPATGLLVGVVTRRRLYLSDQHAIYRVVILNMGGELLASLDIPVEKDKQQIETHLVGPRLVILYNDDSYSVVDLEIFDASSESHDHQLLEVFPLGWVHEKGILVSQRHLARSTDPDAWDICYFSKASQFNIVVNHTTPNQHSNLMNHIRIFSFVKPTIEKNKPELEQKDYRNLLKETLKNMCRDRKLQVSGTKTQLSDRLNDDDKSMKKGIGTARTSMVLRSTIMLRKKPVAPAGSGGGIKHETLSGTGSGSREGNDDRQRLKRNKEDGGQESLTGRRRSPKFKHY